MEEISLSEGSNTKIVQSDIGSKDGQNKCPKCGATDIVLNPNTGKLKCMYCRIEFESLKVEGFATDISSLQGQVIGSGANNIIADTNEVKTFKCSSCGAEVVIDASSATQARCHWCRSTLSINQQMPNGAIPDVVLPFKLNKNGAQQEIEKFVGKRKFFAHPKFKEEFTTDNIMGVYFPYMLVDINAHANFVGKGEHLVRTYYRKNGNSQTTYYDADLYEVGRDFDLTINGLSVESSSDKLKVASNKTNNVINAIMPFDIENCVKYNANYLRGYTSERRDTNVEQLKTIVELQAKDVARFSCNTTLKHYNRGVAWENERLDIKGEQWKAAYLPVWLYSYQQVKGDKKLLHYVAVNARTKETMGSVPIHMPKLLGISFLVEILGILAMIFVDWDYSWAFLLAGFIFFIIIFMRYRNSNARHTYETETKTNITNLQNFDRLIQHKKGLTNSMIEGANNKMVNGQVLSNQILDTLTNQNPVANIIKDNINKGGN